MEENKQLNLSLVINSPILTEESEGWNSVAKNSDHHESAGM